MWAPPKQEHREKMETIAREFGGTLRRSGDYRWLYDFHNDLKAQAFQKEIKRYAWVVYADRFSGHLVEVEL